MSNIYWELPEIPIPDQAHINRSDGRVFLLGSRAGGKPTASRNVIGHATPETHMHANSLFKSIFPDLWKAHYGSNPPFMNEMNSGLDLIVLSILSRNGLLDILYQIYKSKYANAILDYAAYSVEYSSNVAMSFTEKMKNYIFSHTRHTVTLGTQTYLKMKYLRKKILGYGSFDSLNVPFEVQKKHGFLLIGQAMSAILQALIMSKRAIQSM